MGLEKVIGEFFRILKLGGQMAHGELSPAPENTSQKLFIEADSHSLVTLTPRSGWFSPFYDEIATILHRVGFRDIMTRFQVIVFRPCNQPTCAFEGRDCRDCSLIHMERDQSVLLGTVKLHDVDEKGGY